MSTIQRAVNLKVGDKVTVGIGNKVTLSHTKLVGEKLVDLYYGNGFFKMRVPSFWLFEVTRVTPPEERVLQEILDSCPNTPLAKGVIEALARAGFEITSAGGPVTL